MPNKVSNNTLKHAGCKMRHLTLGQIGVSENGSHYLRTFTGIVSLESGDTFTFGAGSSTGVLSAAQTADMGPNFEVRILPPGTVVTITAG